MQTKPKSQPTLNLMLRSLLLFIGAWLMLLPLIVIVFAAFSPTGTIIKPFSPQTWHWTGANLQTAWQRGSFLLAFANSTLVAVGVTALQILTSTLAGYALARLKFWGQQTLTAVILATLVIPFQILVIPIF